MHSINYPLGHGPSIGDGTAEVIAPGLLWLRMPLFSPLSSINVWTIREGDAWAIIDTGINSEATRQGWDAALSTRLNNLPVSRIFATHMHSDHCGVAGWLAQRFQARLWMSRLEYLLSRLNAAANAETDITSGAAFYRACGWNTAEIDHFKSTFSTSSHMLYPMPAAYRRISDGETLSIGEHEWKVIGGNGHSPEHASLYCKALKVFISGDQVLPEISSNISVSPIEPSANPLADWLVSLQSVINRVPDDVLVLPAHNSPFTGLHTRCSELVASHHRSLGRLVEHLRTPRRVVDVFATLFVRAISPSLLRMATGEAMAHLNYLAHEGQANFESDREGVWWWRRTG